MAYDDINAGQPQAALKKGKGKYAFKLSFSSKPIHYLSMTESAPCTVYYK